MLSWSQSDHLKWLPFYKKYIILWKLIKIEINSDWEMYYQNFDYNYPIPNCEIQYNSVAA